MNAPVNVVVNVADFWPQPDQGEAKIVTFNDGRMKSYCRDARVPGAFRMNEYDQNGSWIDAWLYRIDPVHGVLEFADEYPQRPWLKWFGPVRRTNYARGWENMWGGRQSIGSLISQTVKTAGLFEAFGTNEIRFVSAAATAPELPFYAGPLLQIERTETWAGKALHTTYFLARGIGFVKVRYVAGSQWAVQVQKVRVGVA